MTGMKRGNAAFTLTLRHYKFSFGEQEVKCFVSLNLKNFLKAMQVQFESLIPRLYVFIHILKIYLSCLS